VAAGATIVADSNCNMVCTGNDSYICGGSGVISYYTWTGDPLYVWNYPNGTDAGVYEFLIGGKWSISPIMKNRILNLT
jgi:hypothetical protein